MLKSASIFLAVVALFFAVDAGAVTTEVYEVTNRTGKEIPVVVTQLVLRHATLVKSGASRADGADIRITRCADGALVPMYLDPSTLNTDSAICWVRVSPLAAASTTILTVEFDSSRASSVSDGAKVFDLFDDFSSPSLSSSRWVLPNGSTVAGGVLKPAAAAPSGFTPLVLWKGAHTVQDRNAIIEARIRATAKTGGSLAFFAATTDASQAYIVEHDARSGNVTPDLYRVDAGAAGPISAQGYSWNDNEYVRYQITLRGDSAIILRTSEQSIQRVHLIRIVLSDFLWSWKSLGFSSFEASAGTFEVDWIHVRPRLDVEPIVKRRESSVTITPPSGILCDGSVVTLDGPAGWASYQWSNGSTSKKITVTSPTTLTLTLSDGKGCSVQKGPYTLTAGTAPNGGPDTTFSLCFGKKATLKANAGFPSYKWLIGTGQRQTKVAEGPANSILIDSADIYYCIIASPTGCTDTVIFRVNRVYDNSAGITTSVGGNQMCAGDSVTLYAQPPLSTYEWYKDDVLLSETRSNLKITQPGVYRVRVRIGDSANACLSTSTIEMVQRNRGALNLPPTLDMCEGDTVELDAGAEFTTFKWSSGQTSRKIKVFTSGTYNVIASYNGVCPDTATTVATVKPAALVAIRSVDGRTSMCIGERLDLEHDASTVPVVWSTGETTQRITITSPGTYMATASYPNGCKRTSSITIDNGVMDPVIVALDNQAICDGDSTRLTTTLPYDKYLWSTGETTDTIVVSKVGTYSVEVTLFECRASSSIIIDKASPLGPAVLHTDTVALCGANPAYPLYITNSQIVPRIYSVRVSGAGFTVPSPSYKVPANSTLAVPIVYDGSQGNGVKSALVTMSDVCGWTGTYTVTVDYGSKDLSLSMVATSSEGGLVRAGHLLNLALRVGNPDLFSVPRLRDTVRLAISYDPLHLHLPTGTAQTQYGAAEIDDRAGTISSTLTPFTGGSPAQLIVLQPEALVGTSLTTSINIDSMFINNPCVNPAFDSVFVVTALPYGCEVQTISYSEAPRLSIVKLSDREVTILVDGLGKACTLHLTDVLGRVYSTISLPSSSLPFEVPLQFYGSWQHFVVANNDRGASVLPLVPEGY